MQVAVSKVYVRVWCRRSLCLKIALLNRETSSRPSGLFTSIVSFFGQFLLVGIAILGPFDLHRCVAQNAADDIPGCASASNTAPASAGAAAH